MYFDTQKNFPHVPKIRDKQLQISESADGLRVCDYLTNTIGVEAFSRALHLHCQDLRFLPGTDPDTFSCEGLQAKQEIYWRASFRANSGGGAICMTDLRNIAGMDEDAQDLLEAVGILDLRALAGADVDELAQELDRANRILQYAAHPPTMGDLENWIAAARLCHPKFAPVRTNPPANQPPPNSDGRDDPPTEPHGLIGKTLEPSHAGRKVSSISYVHLAESVSQMRQLDTARVRSFAEIEQLEENTPPAQVQSSGENSGEISRRSLLRTPLEETNRGRDPQSRAYIRGILHTHPISMRFGALNTLILPFLVVSGILATIFLVFSARYPDHFIWVSPWLVAFPAALLVSGVFYLISGIWGRCRICNQRLFFPRACRKNTKAHHIFGLGYIIPLCLHLLIFRWFRCSFCGTSIRLKK